MCTAITLYTDSFYMGRTLDYEFSYGEEITITPRNFPLPLAHGGVLSAHYALIGMAHVADGFPLYYEAANEHGLCMAGLNFVGNAIYADSLRAGAQNIAQYELIPWLLSQCADLTQARELLKQLNLMATPFSPQLPSAQLHWLLADKSGCIVIESDRDGLHLYDNPVGVLTNNPPFPVQLHRLSDYRSLSPRQPENTFAPALPLALYSRGMGALGLPGDLSSSSRFVRAAFTRAHAHCTDSAEDSVSQFFHILGTVEQTRGCCAVADGKFEYTIYSSCISAARGIYYYTTYENRQITAVDMHKTDLDGKALTRYPLLSRQSVFAQN